MSRAHGHHDPQQDISINYQIVQLDICSKTNGIKFTLQNMQNLDLIGLSAEDIMADKTLANNLLYDDAMRIAYVAGMENASRNMPVKLAAVTLGTT